MLDTLNAYGSANPGYALILSALLVPLLVLLNVALFAVLRLLPRCFFPSVAAGGAVLLVILTAHVVGSSLNVA